MKRKTMLAVAAGIYAVVCMMVPAYAHAAVVPALMNHVDVIGALTGHAPMFGAASLAALGIGQITGVGAHADTTSKWFRVAVEGATTDGRNIQREWIEQMAASYDPEKYGARVNCEHIRGYAPLSETNPFGAYGDVIALKAEALADGPLKGKFALYAQIKPTPELVALVNAGQKIYTSIEISYSFADTKQAYLMGLAVTDSPASLGTEILQFAAGLGAKNPLAHRKQSPDNVFSVAEETAIEFEGIEPTQTAPSITSPGLFARVAEIIGLVRTKGASDEKRFADAAQAIEALATHSNEQATRVEELSTQLDTLRTELDAEKGAHASTAKQLEELTAKLSTQPSSAPRAPATGSSGVQTTDC